MGQRDAVTVTSEGAAGVRAEPVCVFVYDKGQYAFQDIVVQALTSHHHISCCHHQFNYQKDKGRVQVSVKWQCLCL